MQSAELDKLVGEGLAPPVNAELDMFVRAIPAKVERRVLTLHTKCGIIFIQATDYYFTLEV